MKFEEQPVDPELAAKMRGVAPVIDTFFNDGLPKSEKTIGFLMLVYPINSNETVHYITNDERKHAESVMLEQMGYMFARAGAEMHESSVDRPRPPPDLLLDVGQLAGLASKIRHHAWIEEHMPDLFRLARDVTLALGHAIGYPFKEKTH